MVAVVTCHHNPFTPTRDFTKEFAEVGRQIKDYAPETKLPFICLLNGKAILRKQWIYQVKDRDVISFVVLPQGGGSNPFRAIAIIGVMALAGWAGGAIAGGMELTASATGSFGAFEAVSAVSSAVIGLAGSALVNALIPAQTASSLSSYSTPSASPTYSIAAQGNSARIGEAIPVQYGKIRCFPDFAASPYVEYRGNEQYLYQLFCIGLGEYDIGKICIEDTPIGNFEEVETQIVNPGEALTLFPANVETSNEVSGQELLKGNPIGPFTTNQAGTKANRIAIDVVFPRGMAYITKKGKVDVKRMKFRVQAREINDYGSAVGSWVTLDEREIQAATTTPIRRSYSYKVTPGRYQVRVERLDEKATTTQDLDEIDWTGMKAYLVDGGKKFNGMTLLAVKIRATNNISSTASRKINVVCTRRLKKWSPNSGWSKPVASQSIAWAFADACKADYGGRLKDQQIDLQALFELDEVWSKHGDKLNLRIDSKSTVWETLQTIAKAGRAKPFRQGGMVRIFRDAHQSVPSGMFTMSNISKDSFSVDYILPTDDTADAIEVEYFDERIWQWKTVTAKMPDSRAEEPVSVKLLGVTDRQQAWREGMYMAACNRLRRKTISIGTEMEGFIPTIGDLIWVSHDMPQWGQSCVVRNWNPTLRVLTVSEPLTWLDGKQHKIVLRKPDGTTFGPVNVIKGGAYNEVMLPSDVEFDFTIQTGDVMEPTYVAFGWDDTWTQPARVLSVRPSSMYKVAIECVNESEGVHVAENGQYPEEIIHSQLPGTDYAPNVYNIIARLNPLNDKEAVISWDPSPWANSYIIEQSTDLETWSRVGESSTSNYYCPLMYDKDTFFRVAAVASVRGEWSNPVAVKTNDFFWHPNELTLMWDPDETVDMWK